MKPHQLIALVCVLLVVACTLQPAPVVPPPDGAGTCETAHAALVGLGGCGLEIEGWVQRCHDAAAAEAELGVRLPVGCLTASTSCEEAGACR